MPRPLRLPPIAFGWYYVVLRALAGKQIVTSREDLQNLLAILRRTLRKGGARLHAGAVTERAIHLAMQTGTMPLSVLIGRFQHDYARLFNKTHGTKGALFRLHHHAILIDHQTWLVSLVHLIHWLPRLDNAVPENVAFRWTTDAVYRGSAKMDWLTKNVALRMLARKSGHRLVREQAYGMLLDRRPALALREAFVNGSAADPRILGDQRFIEEVWRRTGQSPRRKRAGHRSEADISTLVTQLIEKFGEVCLPLLPRAQADEWKHIVTFEGVRSKSRKRPLPMLRALITSYLIVHRIATATETARFWGLGSRPVAAARRRFYEMRFHEGFGMPPNECFGAPGNVWRRAGTP